MNSSLSLINISTFPAVYWWRPAAWLRVRGPDALTFLQGQFTNELRERKPGEAVYGLWLTTKGKVLADSFVLRGGVEEEFWVGSYFSPAAAIRERLESHIIADDVVVEDTTDEWSAASLWNPAPEWQSAARDGFVFTGRRGAEKNIEWVFPRAEGAAARATLNGIRELTTDDVARLRIDARIPAVPADIGPNDLPNEGGLEADAISYTKGCYLGQEVMARLKSMGQVRRRLLRVRGVAATPPPVPAPLFIGARQVGELRSVVSDGTGGIEGLALLSLLHVTGGAELAFSANEPPVVRVVDAL